MNEITADMISRLATQMYQAKPAAPTVASEIPDPRAAAETVERPAELLPEGAPSTVASEPYSAARVSRLSVPTGASVPPVASAPPDRPVPSVPSNLSGLQAFVSQVRAGGSRGEFASLGDPLERLRPRLANSAGRLSAPPVLGDVTAIRAQFPILRQRVNGYPLVWLDNAATTQKPQCVIDAVSRFYERDNSNIHRGAHTLAARATDAYEGARERIRAFLGASSSREIVFARGTTEAINLVARTFGQKFVSAGDELVLTVLEHHANIVPWQMLAKEKGASLRVVPVNDAGEIQLGEFERLLGPRTRLVALAHANNSLGTILPVAEMTAMAKRHGARVLIDGAQSVAHLPVNVRQLGADFYVFSGHKIFGPTGIGAVYITEELHDVLPPWQGGGNMIRNVTFEATTYADSPARFEAGTPNIADAVGLGAALDFVQQLGWETIARHEHELLQYATEQLLRVPGLRLIGQARHKVGVLSFVLPGLTTEQIGQRLDQVGIAVRSGHHCAQPSLRRFGLETTVRPSLSLYNTRDEIDHLAATLHRIARS